MSFLAFLQHTQEQHFLDLLVGEDVLEMTHAAVIRSCFLLHALEMVGVAAVDADEGVLLARYFFLAGTKP